MNFKFIQFKDPFDTLISSSAYTALALIILVMVMLTSTGAYIIESRKTKKSGINYNFFICRRYIQLRIK